MRPHSSVLKFSDYRAFLVAHVQSRKKKNGRWSYGTWARQMRLKSTSSLTKILQGARNPGETVTSQLIRYFGFTEKETEHFRDLISLDKMFIPEGKGPKPLPSVSYRFDFERRRKELIQLCEELRKEFTTNLKNHSMTEEALKAIQIEVDYWTKHDPLKEDRLQYEAGKEFDDAERKLRGGTGQDPQTARVGNPYAGTAYHRPKV